MNSLSVFGASLLILAFSSLAISLSDGHLSPYGGLSIATFAGIGVLMVLDGTNRQRIGKLFARRLVYIHAVVRRKTRHIER